MRKFFLFLYAGEFYRCISLPFGWGSSGFWFMKLPRLLVRYIREEMGCRVLPYIDDFLLAPSPTGQAATAEDC